MIGLFNLGQEKHHSLARMHRHNLIMLYFIQKLIGFLLSWRNWLHETLQNITLMMIIIQAHSSI